MSKTEIILKQQDEIKRLREVIAVNCDPSDATLEDKEIIAECHKLTFPDNYKSIGGEE